MAKFKCKLSGNIFEFVNEFDIEDMRKHPQYDEVKDVWQEEEEQDTKKKVTKPRKAKEAE